MHYRMRDGLSWCVSEGRTVFLDLESDRYFRLGLEDDRAFQNWAQSGEANMLDPAGLVRAGVLVPCSDPHPLLAMTQVTMPLADVAEEAGTRARIVDIMHGLVAQRQAARAIRRGALAKLVGGIRTGRTPPPTCDPEATVRRIAAAFASTPLSFRKSGQCLPRALAAHAMCRRSGVVPTLVFGVRVAPFAAHCWLQFGSHIVVGDLEQARMFTPILAVP